MFWVECDSKNQLLTIAYSGRVEAVEMPLCVQKVKTGLAVMGRGFRLRADFSAMESMGSVCALYLAQIMDLCSAKEVGGIFRVVPDHHKDIGLNILSFFHYVPGVAIMTYESLEAAMQGLQD